MNSLHFTISHEGERYQAIVSQAVDVEGRRAARARILLCVNCVEVGSRLLVVRLQALEAFLKWEILEDGRYLEDAKDMFLAQKLIVKALDPRVDFHVLT